MVASVPTTHMVALLTTPPRGARAHRVLAPFPPRHEPARYDTPVRSRSPSRGARRSLSHLKVECFAEKGLIGCGEQQRRTEFGESIGVAQELQRLRGRLSKIKSRVEDHLLWTETGIVGPLATFEQIARDRRSDVVVVRVGVVHTRAQSNVRRDDGRARALGRRQVLGIGEPADVVAHTGTRLVA